MAETVLIVDDEPDVLELVVFNLRKAGFRPVTATDGAAALQVARDLLPSLVVLDLMLPQVEGMDVCRQLKADPRTAHIPILMLTARAEETDRVIGFELGADDYVVKPFSPRELVLRVKTILRRGQGRAQPAEVLRADELVVDLAKHEVQVKKRAIDLTATEFKLLATLLERRGRVQTRDRLLTDVWDYAADTDTRTVDTHVRRLREKLCPTGDLIETVRGVGYRFAD